LAGGEDGPGGGSPLEKKKKKKGVCTKHVVYILFYVNTI
jgi:hypothetical protein